MKRLPIILLFGIAIVTCFVSFELYFDRQDWARIYRSDYVIQADRLEDEAVLARAVLISRDNVDDLVEVLHSLTKLNNIDFWYLLYDGKLYDTNVEEGERDRYLFTLQEPRILHYVDNAKYSREKYSYVSIDLKEKFQLVVGLKYHEEAFFRNQLVERKSAMITYLFGIIFLALGTFAFFFRDIMRAIKNLQNNGKRSYVDSTVRSKEADLLTRGFAAYEGHARRLEEERDLLSWQVLPALRTELMSGRAPPYDFNCTLVRTDINNFSKIYNEYPIEEFTETINEFFTEVTHIVSRYGGLIHEFIGDEVLFYFKDEDSGDSPLIALSALRDINEAAARINKRTSLERGYAFTIKSSFAHGKIRFARFVNGFNLAGSILIETVRILSHVVEKSGNVVIFDDRHRSAVENVVNAGWHGNAMLRGFTSEKVLFIYLGHKDLSLILDDKNPNNIEKLRYYRSDADILQCLAWARTQAAKGDVTNALKVVGLMRLFAITKADGRAQHDLANWLDELYLDLAATPAHTSSNTGADKGVSESEAKVLASDRDGQLRVFASALRLIENLVPKKDFDLEFGARFNQILQKAKTIDDRRVVANALDVLSYFKSKKYPVISDELLRHPDNRVAANAIVNEGIKELTPRIVRQLRKMLSSKIPVNQASGIYALGELVAHYRLKDPVYLSTQLKFNDLVLSIPNYASSTDVMVRRQTLIAARKAGDAKIYAEIWAMVDVSPSNSAFAQEVQDHMGMKPEGLKDAA